MVLLRRRATRRGTGARLERVETLTETTKHFVWQVTGPEGSGAFRFVAGQFISLHLERNGADDVHPYSIRDS